MANRSGVAATAKGKNKSQPGGKAARVRAQDPLGNADGAKPGTTTKKIIFHTVAEKTHLPQSEVNRVCQSFLDEIIVELKRGHRLEFRDFGVFEVRDRAPRTAQNPKTLQKVIVPAKRAVKFKVGRLMRESVRTTQERLASRRENADRPASAEVVITAAATGAASALPNR